MILISKRYLLILNQFTYRTYAFTRKWKFFRGLTVAYRKIMKFVHDKMNKLATIRYSFVLCDTEGWSLKCLANRLARLVIQSTNFHLPNPNECRGHCWSWHFSNDWWFQRQTIECSFLRRWHVILNFVNRNYSSAFADTNIELSIDWF